MKKITLLGSIVVLLLFTCVVKAQDRKPFHIIPLVPVAGQDVKFTYDNSLTSLADEETIYGTVYYWENLRHGKPLVACLKIVRWYHVNFMRGTKRIQEDVPRTRQ